MVVFDYPDEIFLNASERRVQNTIVMAKAGGEPMQTALSYETIARILNKHGFQISELLKPDEIQRKIIDPTLGAMKAFEYVNYCLAVKENNLKKKDDNL